MGPTLAGPRVGRRPWAWFMGMTRVPNRAWIPGFCLGAWGIKVVPRYHTVIVTVPKLNGLFLLPKELRSVREKWFVSRSGLFRKERLFPGNFLGNGKKMQSVRKYKPYLPGKPAQIWPTTRFSKGILQIYGRNYNYNNNYGLYRYI